MIRFFLYTVGFSFTALCICPQKSYGESMFLNNAFNQLEIEERIHQVENGLLPAIAITGFPISISTLEQKMKQYDVPAVTIAVINNGEIEWAKSYGVLEKNTHRVTQ